MSDYINLTALGEIYGVKARDVGAWLKGLGLRQQDGRPSQQAVKEGFVKELLTEYGSAWLWQRERRA